MSYVFTDFFRAQLFTNQALMNGASIQVVYFSTYATFTDPLDTRYTTLKTVANLQSVIGWSTALPSTVAQTVSTVTSAAAGSNSRYVIANNPFVNNAAWVDTKVVAAAVIYVGSVGGTTNPIIFITDTPFGDVLRKVDQLAALPNTAVTPNRPLFVWPIPAAGATQLFPVEGTLAVINAPPDYEYSHQQHLWLFPQRANMLANPSFELGTNHWKSSATLTRVSGGAPGGGVWEGRVSGSGTTMKKAPFYLKSTRYVSTDAQPLDVPFTIKAKINLTTLTVTSDLVRHGMVTPNLAWRVYFASGELRLSLSYDGLTMFDVTPPILTAAELDGIANPNTDFYVGVQVFSWVDFVAYQAITSADGLGWTTVTALKSADVAAQDVFVSPGRYQVGGTNLSGKVYWASLEQEGVLKWRFDASSAYMRSSWTGNDGLPWEVDDPALVTAVDGTTGNSLVLESNPFPTKLKMADSDQWTIQAMIKGVGRVRVGLLSWESDFGSTYTDWGADGEVWTLSAGGFLHIYAQRRVHEGSSAVVRIECEGTDMHIDNVLAEPEWLPGWPYFDGDTTYGAVDDFSWYGGTNQKGKSYSLWYNHRRAVVGRLFAWSIADDDFTVTDTEVEAQGYVYKWVPAGVRVIPHLDVLTVGDVQSPVPAVTGTVMAVRTGYTDALGVYPAWAVATD